MAYALKKYIPRAPRYILRPEDNEMVRFAQTGDSGKSSSTHIVNVSQSGMAFRVQKHLAPTLGELIMVEFVVPGAEQMACYGRVVRLEEPHDDRNAHDELADDLIVAVKFHALRGPHERNLSKGLKKKFLRMQRKHQVNYFTQSFRDMFLWFYRYRQQILLTGGALLLATALLYAMAVMIDHEGAFQQLQFRSSSSQGK